MIFLEPLKIYKFYLAHLKVFEQIISYVHTSPVKYYNRNIDLSVREICLNVMLIGLSSQI